MGCIYQEQNLKQHYMQLLPYVQIIIKGSNKAFKIDANPHILRLWAQFNPAHLQKPIRTNTVSNPWLNKSSKCENFDLLK